jgi:hypothetical protein
MRRPSFIVHNDRSYDINAIIDGVIAEVAPALQGFSDEIARIIARDWEESRADWTGRGLPDAPGDLDAIRLRCRLRVYAMDRFVALSDPDLRHIYKHARLILGASPCAKAEEFGPAIRLISELTIGNMPPINGCASANCHCMMDILTDEDLDELTMPIVSCRECSGQVSSAAEKCPLCGAPFEAFMPKAKGIADFFSQDRQRARQRKADAKTKSAAMGCFSALLGLVGLVFLVILIVGFIA